VTTSNWHCTGKKEFDEATQPQQLDLTGFRLHPLRDDLAGYWSITVSANWDHLPL
jgi:proteic killer suppression protein